MLSRRAGLAFLAPGLALVALFLFLPFAWVLWVSFTSQTLLGEGAVNPRWVGFENYARLLDFSRWARPGEFGHSLWVTVLFTLGSVAGQTLIGLAVAVAFFRRRGVWREAVFTLATLCWILPEVPVVFGWVSFLDRDFGTLNALSGALGLGQPDWLLERPLLSIIVFNTWRGAAFSMLLYSAALASIPPSHLEAAWVAGARPRHVLRDIVWPRLRRHLGTSLALVSLWTLNTFSPYLITKGGPAFATDLLSIHAYRVAFQYFEFGRGGAIAVTIMLVNVALAAVYLVSLRRAGARA